MSREAWLRCIDPKCKGVWNVHNALVAEGVQLDFFLLTSSVSGSVGTATESNYCAANAFLDSFARYQQSLGIPSISVGFGMISEVGYLHEHPEIEALLLRKGIQALTEDELLQICDIALTSVTGKASVLGEEHLVSAHILTGLETSGLQRIRRKGFEGKEHVLNDPRAAIIARCLTSSTDENTPEVSSLDRMNQHAQLPKPVSAALALACTCDDASTKALLLDPVTLAISEKISNLLLVPLEQLNAETRLAEFGMDSMLAAEFRQFVFHIFEADVPFPTLLGQSTNIADLASIVVKDLLERRLRG